MEEAFQRGRVEALVGQRQRHELVDGVARFDAKPRQDARAHLGPRQDRGIEFVRRRIVRGGERRGEEVRGLGAARIVGPCVLQRLPLGRPVARHGFICVIHAARAIQREDEMERGERGWRNLAAAAPRRVWR